MSGGVPGTPPVKCFPHSAGVIFVKVGRSDAPTTGQRRTVTEAGHRPRRVIGRRVCAPTRLRRSGGRVAPARTSRHSCVCSRLRATAPPSEALHRLLITALTISGRISRVPRLRRRCASCTDRSRSVQGWSHGCTSNTASVSQPQRRRSDRGWGPTATQTRTPGGIVARRRGV